MNRFQLIKELKSIIVAYGRTRACARSFHCLISCKLRQIVVTRLHKIQALLWNRVLFTLGLGICIISYYILLVDIQKQNQSSIKKTPIHQINNKHKKKRDHSFKSSFDHHHDHKEKTKRALETIIFERIY